MNIVKQDNRQPIRYRGANWRGMQLPVSLKPKDAAICCDLRDSKLDGLDLSGVEFFGCRLNGTSFRGATLRQTRFIGCFSSEEASPTDFSNSIREDVLAINSHLHFTDQTLTDPLWGDDLMMSDFDPQSAIVKWPSEVAKVATKTLCKRNDIRYDAAIALGELDNPVVAPLLGCLLADPEWEVRSIALQVLANLRHQEFPQGDRWLLEWMFRRLADEHSIVRQTALEWVEKISPPDDVLLAAIGSIMAGSPAEQMFGIQAVIDLGEIDKRYLSLIPPLDNVLLAVIHRMMASSAEEQLAALYAAIDLCELDRRYSRLVNKNAIQVLLSSQDAEVREQAVALRERVDDGQNFPTLAGTGGDLDSPPGYRVNEKGAKY